MLWFYIYFGFKTFQNNINWLKTLKPKLDVLKPLMANHVVNIALQVFAPFYEIDNTGLECTEKKTLPKTCV